MLLHHKYHSNFRKYLATCVVTIFLIETISASLALKTLSWKTDDHLEAIVMVG